MTEAPGSPEGRAKRPRSREEFEAQMRATNARINARSGRNLLTATLVGLLLGASLLGSLLIVPAIFMVLALAFIVLTAFELSGALRFAGRDVPRTPLMISAVVLVPVTYYGVPAIGIGPDAGHWLATLAGCALVTVWRLLELLIPSRRAAPAEVGKDLMAGLLVMIYVEFFGSFTVLLATQEGGQWWLIAFLVVVVSIDTGAYTAGVLFGKHKMAPNISPGKTWEGFFGSIVFAAVAGVLTAWLMLQQPLWVGLILAAVMVVTATSGDLAESLLKRDLGIKDISTWLPGHGGVLDRLDSTLLSAPAAYALFVVFA
jgi:phosphatidate cytidylyltransferase